MFFGPAITWVLGFSTKRMMAIGCAVAAATMVLSWRSTLIEKGEQEAVQRIEKQEKKRAKVIRSAGAKSLNNRVRGIADVHTVD